MQQILVSFPFCFQMDFPPQNIPGNHFCQTLPWVPLGLPPSSPPTPTPESQSAILITAPLVTLEGSLSVSLLPHLDASPPFQC